MPIFVLCMDEQLIFFPINLKAKTLQPGVMMTAEAVQKVINYLTVGAGLETEGVLSF